MGEEESCLKYFVVVLGGSHCSCCQQQLSLGAEVLSTVLAVPHMAWASVEKALRAPLCVSCITEQWLALCAGKQAQVYVS